MADRKKSALAGRESHPAWVPGGSDDLSAPEVPAQSGDHAIASPVPVAPEPPVAQSKPIAVVPQPETPVPPMAIARKPRKPSPAVTRPAQHSRHDVEWTIHSRQFRAGLLAWAAARAKVDDRAKDIREHLSVAGHRIDPDEKLKIAELIAEQTGYPLVEVVEAAGLARDV